MLQVLVREHRSVCDYMTPSIQTICPALMFCIDPSCVCHSPSLVILRCILVQSVDPRSSSHCRTVHMEMQIRVVYARFVLSDSSIRRTIEQGSIHASPWVYRITQINLNAVRLKACLGVDT